MLRRELWFAVLAVVAIAGCRVGPGGSGPAKTYPKPTPDPWTISCLDPTEEVPALLWNGLIGLRISRDGAGAPGDTFFSIKAYEPNGEEKILPLPNPFAGKWQVNGTAIDPTRGDDYSQTLNMQSGVLTTSWTQPLGPVKVAVRCDTVVHPTRPVAVQNWTLSKLPKSLVEYRSNKWESPATPLGQGGGESALQGARLTYDYSVDGGDEGVLRTEGNQEVFRAQISDEGQVSLDCVARLGDEGREPSYGSVLQASMQAWARRWATDIVIDGPVEDQQAVRSFLFYLRSGIHPEGGMAISPMGLSSATYNGHVFWDADVWVFPALALVDPTAAKAIPDYRLRMFEENSGGSSEPKNLSPQPPSPAGKGGGLVAPFPWESSVTGKEVAPPITRDEIHINGDVAFMLDQAAALGLADPKAARQVRDAVGRYYGLRAVREPGKLDELRDVVSPDENHKGDNDLYTNLLAEWCLNPPERQSIQLFKRPKDDKSYLTYDNDALRGYKQAAAVLAIYPLQMVDDKQARVMMDRFANKTTANGPAMSQSVHALIWARLGESTKAYESWKKSWKDYTNHPMLLFSEKPKKEATYFTTGAAGCLQTVLYGFLGFRIDCRKDSMAAWSNALNGMSRLSIKPNLPAAWKSVKFTNFSVRGKRFTLTIDANGVKVTQGES